MWLDHAIPMLRPGHRPRHVLALGIGLAPLAVPAAARAWEPGARDRNAAIDAADMTGYFAMLSDWLDRRVPADPALIARQGAQPLLDDPAFVALLAERHFMAKVAGCGEGPVAGLNQFAARGPENREFLRWVMSDGRIMDEIMLARTPTAMFARIDDSHSIDGGTLATLREICEAHPELREGIHLKLAIATALRPPGSANQGAGKPATPDSPLSRFVHFLQAHRNGELAPSFDTLNTWEMTHVVSACASNDDLGWGREMVRTFLPQAMEGERIVQLVSIVKVQKSPIPYDDMSCVLAGGGACGPRSSFGVFINQAFGIPSIGVGQPGHAAVCWRDPEGNWQVGYGRGWNVSKVTDRYQMSGEEFVAAARERGTGRFARVEHLRWLAAVIEKPSACYLPPADRRYVNPRAAAVMQLAESLPQTAGQAALTAPVRRKPEGPAPEPPIKVAPGVIHVEAEDFFTCGGIVLYAGSHPNVPVVDCRDGGRQLCFQPNMADACVGYRIFVPKAGVYDLTARVAVVNPDQCLFARTFGTMPRPKSATVSSVYKDNTRDLGADKAVDSDIGTRWAVNEGTDQAWLELDMGAPIEFGTFLIDERTWNRVSKFKVEYKDGGGWQPVHEGTNIGVGFSRRFPPVMARFIRLNILECRDNGGPTIWDFSVGSVADGHGFIHPAWSRATIPADPAGDNPATPDNEGVRRPGLAGRWQTTSPLPLRLAQGEQTVWLSAGFQRGLALRWFQLAPRADPP